jgi:hypothetical protein
MKHHIQRQELLIDIAPRSDAFRIQHAAAQYARNTLLPALDEIFNELSTEDVVIRIDRIIIDLGFLDEAGLQTGVLSSAMYQRIKEELRRVILGESPENPVTRSAVRDNVLTQWWYYMEHGRLPWNSDRPDEQWYAKVLEMFSVDYAAISRLRRALRDKPYFRARISAQHNTAFLENLVTALTSVRHDELGTAVAELARTLQFIGQLADGRLLGAPPPDKPQDKPDKPPEKPPDKSPGRRATRQMIRQWTRRLAIFLALPESQREGFIWNRLLEDAATRPAEWAREGGINILLDWIWDRPPLMRLLEDAFTGADNLFISRFRSRYAAIGKRTGDGTSPRASRAESPATGKPTDQTQEPVTPDPENLNMANSPQLNLPRQPTPPTPADGKELDLAIEEACRIIQFLADKYRGLTTGQDQSQTPQASADLKFLFIQWAERMEDILAVPGYARGNYIRRWLRDVTKSRSAEWANADAISILLDRIWDSPVLMGIAADALTSRAGRFTKQFNDRLKPLQHKDKPPAIEPAPGQPEKASREEDFLFSDEQVPEEGMLIPNAGVILVHPFLATFFDRLGLRQGKTFKDLDARQQAIYLIHYLATGQRIAPEYELLLPKMLCGYALEMPLPGDILLTDEACAEGDLLLQNVVQRWEKLKNSSVDALREGFLQRNGKLYNRNDRLSLQVEASSIDVLLDSLPWNLSLVKLPWLKEMLYVEWR